VKIKDNLTIDGTPFVVHVYFIVFVTKNDIKKERCFNAYHSGLIMFH